MRQTVIVSVFVAAISIVGFTQTGGVGMDNQLNENKALIKRLFEEEINQKKLETLESMVTPDYISHNDSVSPLSNVQQGTKFLTSVFAAFPDTQVIIEDIIAEADKVVVRNTWRGTFRGPWMGITPTGKSVTWTGIVMWRIKNGKIAERWANTNFPEVMQQIAKQTAEPK